MMVSNGIVGYACSGCVLWVRARHREQVGRFMERRADGTIETVRHRDYDLACHTGLIVLAMRASTASQ
jgi:hypothetical protein